VQDLVVTPELTIPASDLKWRAVRSSGPGGQNVNKVATKVELRFDLAHSEAIPEPVRARLRRIAMTFLDAEGAVVITSQATRTQRQNLEQALENLGKLVQRALVVPRKRVKTKPTSGSRMRRLQGKHLQSEKKRTRRRVSEE
jgi:ribosome-associated protein